MATPWSRAQMGVTWVPTTTPIPNDGINTIVHSNGGMGAAYDSTWSRLFHHDGVHASTTMGVTTTVLPNPLSTQIQAHAPRPSSTVQECTGQSVAITRCTSGRRGQKLDAPKLQGKLLTPDKEEDGFARGHLFVFLFHFFQSPFYRKYNLSPPLGNYKRRDRGPSRGVAIWNTTHWASAQAHTPSKRLGIRSLS
jgi:hypothetical protein